MRSYHLLVVTPDGAVFDGECESLLVRTSDGDIEILAGHMDYMASLGTGRARILTGGVSKFAACSGGFLTVSGGEVKLVSVTFEYKEDIDLARAEKAKADAEERISSAKSDRELSLAKAKLQRALSRIGVAQM